MSFSLIMFYFMALAGAHKRVVMQLREQLVLVRRVLGQGHGAGLWSVPPSRQKPQLLPSTPAFHRFGFMPSPSSLLSHYCPIQSMYRGSVIFRHLDIFRHVLSVPGWHLGAVSESMFVGYSGNCIVLVID